MNPTTSTVTGLGLATMVRFGVTSDIRRVRASTAIPGEQNPSDDQVCFKLQRTPPTLVWPAPTTPPFQTIPAGTPDM